MGAKCSYHKFPTDWLQKDSGVWFEPLALVEAVLDRDEDRFNELKRNGAHDIDVADSFGRTALYRESEKGNLESVKLLQQAGADVNSALLRSVREGNVESVKLLQQAGANLNVKDSAGCSILDIAVDHHQKECAEYLRSLG